MPSDVNAFTSQLMGVIGAAVSKLVPKAKPSQYAKRWWSEDLSKLRSEYTLCRNQESRARRQGYRDGDLEQQAQVAKIVYYKTLRSLKKVALG